MANVIQLRDGSTHTVFDLRDALRLVEEHMGDETRRLLDDCIAEIEDPEQYNSDLEKENQRLREHHHEVMQALRSLSETEAKLIQEKEINRQALSAVAGKIGTITWREINVG